jgi:protein-S-isoprenylcysteine O-methyltransferase Ste14
MMTNEYGYGVWPAVIVNVVLILFFALGSLAPKGKWEWRSLGVFTGFLVALFSEMYGFPLRQMAGLFGQRYLEYKKAVPAFLPHFRPRNQQTNAADYPSRL